MTRIGVALAPGRLLAITPTGERHEFSWDRDVRTAFAALREAVALPVARVTVALVPPLVELRLLSLPPLRDDERRRVLARDAARHFIGVREPQVIGANVLSYRGAPVSVVAAAASAGLVEEIEAGLAGVGWMLASIVPAQAAWAVHANGTIVARLPQATEVVWVERGRVIERRRLKPDAADPPGAQPLDDPLALAAACAPRVHQLELCSEGRHAIRRRVARRAAAGLAIVAATCLVLAAGIDYWGLGRQLAAVRARRTALAPAVAAAMQDRDSLGALTASLTTLATLRATAPRWSAFLTDLADYLPRDAHLVTLHADADSAVLHGVARHAGGVFQAVQRMPGVTGVRAEAPIRQDLAPDGTAREQFALGALVRAGVSDAKVPP
jgi:hypothetical protein